MKVYVVTEYGGSYDDSWDHIIGIFTDKDMAEGVKETYWAGVQKRLKEVNALVEAANCSTEDYTGEQFTIINEQYHLQDIAGVKIDEYALDKFLGGYYHG